MEQPGKIYFKNAYTVDLGRLGVLLVATPLCDITTVIRQTLLEKVAQGKSVWRILRGEL